MEFLDEDARPRFLFQSRPPPSSLTHQTQNPTKPYLFITITITISSLLFLLSILYLQTEPLKSLLFWLSLSLFLGPLAPSHLTAGHIRVGHGPILQPLTPQPEPEKKPHQKRSKPVRSEETQITTNSSSSSSPTIIEEDKNNGLGLGLGLGLSKDYQNGVVLEESEWSEEDFEILKKQLAKNPVGKVGRWEIIAEAFKGRHKVENVIKKAKELGERKSDGGGDDYARFLKNRKPLDVRGGNNELLIENNDNNNNNNNNWSSGEDIALLNALKAFPKDVAMRWEKIAAAVPGKNKAACVKRVAELKRGFRSSKPGAEG